MIKKLVMVITLILMVVLVFGCSTAKNSGSSDMEDINREADRISLNDDDGFNGEENPQVVDPVKFIDPAYESSTSVNLLPGYTAADGDRVSSERMYMLSSDFNIESITKTSFSKGEDMSAFELGLYELSDGAWISVDRAFVFTLDKNTIDLYSGLSYETPYYDLDAGANFIVPLYVNGEDITLEATLHKSGVRTFTYLFANEYDTEKNVILAGYVFISEQRHIMGEFDGSYFDEPNKLPDLGENGEVFAVTIEFKE